MPSISSPALLATKNAVGTVIVGANTAIRFTGAVTVSVDGPSQTEVNVGGVGTFMDRNFGNALPSIVNLDLGANRITNMADPIANQDAATKIYVDSAITGWGLAGNALLVGQFLGSTNNTDVEFKRFGTQYVLLTATGLNFNQGGYLFNFATNSLAFGNQLTGGTVFTVAAGALAFGQSSNAGSVQVSGIGSEASGQTDNNGAIIASGIGSKAFGITDNNGSIQATGNGALAFGRSIVGAANIAAIGVGSIAFGVHGGAAGTIDTNNLAAFSSGYVSGTGSIRANEDGGFARGVVGDGQIGVSAGGFAGVAWGFSTGAGSTIDVIGPAGWAVGYVQNGFTISSSGSAAFAFGFSTAGNITAVGNGSFCGGNTQNGAVLGNAIGSFTWGDDLSGSAEFGTTFGLGHTNSSYLSLVLGRYSVGGGTTNAWVSTDKLFVCGNGASSVARNDAFTVFKDGRVETTASQVHKAIAVTGGALAIDARSNRTIIYDTGGAGGNLTLPAGEEGLEFLFGRANAGAGSFPLVPNGGDTLGPAVPATLDNTTDGLHIQFTGGVWYKVA